MDLLRTLLNISNDSIITEASKAQKLQLKKAQADEKRREQLAAKKAEEERLAAIIAKKQNKKLTAISQKISDTKPTKQVTGGWADHPELSKYMVDPNIDTDFEGGYYLKFHTDLDGTTAYWSKGNLSYKQAVTFKQVEVMGKRFNAGQFESLVENLVQATSKGGQPGYVHIEIDKRFINNPFFTALYKYLLKEYPTDTPTVSGTVNWELV